MTRLQYLEDLIGLKVKSVQDLKGPKRENYAEIEKRVMQRYKSPSLPAYLLYEYHFNDQNIPSLAAKLDVSQTTLFRIMRSLEIPTRSISESQNKRQVLEKLVRKKYDLSYITYLRRQYKSQKLSLREISRKIKKEFNIYLSRQTLLNIMEQEGIKRREASLAHNLVRSKKKKK